MRGLRVIGAVGDVQVIEHPACLPGLKGQHSVLGQGTEKKSPSHETVRKRKPEIIRNNLYPGPSRIRTALHSDPVTRRNRSRSHAKISPSNPIVPGRSIARLHSGCQLLGLLLLLSSTLLFSPDPPSFPLNRRTPRDPAASSICGRARKPSTITMARVYADVNEHMPRSYWDYDSVNISWGVLENYEIVRKIGT